jgi:MFS family permease
MRRWISLLAVCILTSVPSGPVVSWPTLEPILIEEGVFSGPDQQKDLSTVYSISAGTMMIASFVAGIAYDRFGPRVMAVGGTLLAAASLIGMSVALSNRNLNGLLFVFYPLATFFGQSNVFGCYAWLWLLPRSQNTVNSLAAAVQTLSDSIALVAVYLHSSQQYRLSMQTFFASLAVFALLACAVLTILVPSFADNRRYTRAGLQMMGAANAEAADAGGADAGVAGAGIAASVPSSRSCCARECALCRDSVAAAGLHRGTSIAFLLYCMLTWLFFLYPSVQMYPFYEALLGTRQATRLVDIFALIYGLGGAVAVVAFGRLVDSVGVRRVLYWTNVSSALFLAALLQRSFAWQVAAQVLETLTLNSMVVLCFRYAMLYAPPELFGTFSGLFVAFMGAAQILLMPCVRRLSRAVAPGDDRGAQVHRFFGIFTVLGLLSLASGCALVRRWHFHPPPPVGSVTMEEVRRRGRPRGYLPRAGTVVSSQRVGGEGEALPVGVVGTLAQASF